MRVLLHDGIAAGVDTRTAVGQKKTLESSQDFAVACQEDGVVDATLA